MRNASTVAIRRCTYCAKEWDLPDGAVGPDGLCSSVGPDELCSFKHAHSNGWYRTGHQLDTITIAIPDDPSGLWN